MKIFLFDFAKCNGCYGCQLACKDEHVDNDWFPIARPQPELGHFWLKLHEIVHGQVPKVKVEYRAVLCMHCDEPSCAQISDAVYKRADGLVILDPTKATYKSVLDACPYHAIYWNEELQIAQKCTGCAHLIDQGEQPRCVDFCATGALRFGEESDFAAELAEAETLQPELSTKPRVYYLNMPKLFLAGEIWAPAIDESIIGAKVTLIDDKGQKWETETDDFGDFWFRRLEAGVYTLTVQAKGYADYRQDKILLDKSLNVGAIALEQLP